MALALSDLPSTTTIASDSLLHIRTAAGNDFNITGTNFFKQSNLDAAFNTLAIGFGTAPSVLLDVRGSTSPQEVARFSGSGGSGSVQGIVYVGLDRYGGGTYPGVRFFAEEIDIADWRHNFGIQINGVDSDSAPTTRLKIEHTGNTILGDCSVSPDGTLHVRTGSAGSVSVNAVADDFIIENATDTGMSILSGDASGDYGSIYWGNDTDPVAAAIRHSQHSGIFSLGTHSTGHGVSILSGNFTEAIRIDSSQYVGVGVATPGQNIVGTYDWTAGNVLHLEGGNQPNMIVRGSVSASLSLIDSGGAANVKWTRWYNESGFTKLQVLDDTGSATDGITYDHTNNRIGIGSVPSYKLDVNGQLQIRTNNAPTETDLITNGNAVIGAESSLSVLLKTGAYFRVITGATDHTTGTSSGTERFKINSAGHAIFNTTPYMDTNSMNLNYDGTTWSNIFQFFIGPSNVLRLENSGGTYRAWFDGALFGNNPAIVEGTSVTENTVFDTLAPYLTGTEYVKISGGWRNVASETGGMRTASYLYYDGANTITLYGIDQNGQLQSRACVNGDTGTLYEVRICMG